MTGTIGQGAQFVPMSAIRTKRRVSPSTPGSARLHRQACDRRPRLRVSAVTGRHRMRDKETTSNPDDLYLAVMEFIRSIRQVDDMDRMAVHRRRRIISAKADEVATNFGVEASELVNLTINMMERRGSPVTSADVAPSGRG